MSSTKSPSDSNAITNEGDNDNANANTNTNAKEKSPADIPKEDLVHLCMKLNKRMQGIIIIIICIIIVNIIIIVIKLWKVKGRHYLNEKILS